MISYARQLGLGEKTGINLHNESAGRVPTFKSGFAVNHMSSHGDDFKVTAMQLATLVSAIANGGRLLRPFVPHAHQDESKFTTKVRRSVSITAESFQHLLPGMIGSVSYGSGRRAFDPQETVLGKTGTCIEQGTWVGLFTSYAPLKNPKLAIVVIARGSDGRNHFPAAVAGRIYRGLNGRFELMANPQLAAAPNTRTEKTDARSVTSPSVVDEIASDDEDSDDADADNAKATNSTMPAVSTQKPLWGNTRTLSESKVKSTLMPIPQRKSDAKMQTTTSPQTMERKRRVLPGQN
jgi:penicillin-binding protein 2